MAKLIKSGSLMVVLTLVLSLVMVLAPSVGQAASQ